MPRKPFETEDLSADPMSRLLAESKKRLEEGQEPEAPASARRETAPKPRRTKAPSQPPPRPAEQPADVVELRDGRQPAPPATRPSAPRPEASAGKGAEKPTKAPRGRLPAKRIEYDREDYDRVEDFLRALSRRSGSRLSFNILGRSLVRIAMRAEAEIFSAIDRQGVGERPSNNDAGALANYEDEWTELLDVALRQSPRSR